MYYTYVLLCQHTNDSKRYFYIGSSSDIKERLENHRSKSVQTTKKFDKISLVYYEVCSNKTDARKRELQLKTGFGRGYINRRLENFLRKQDAGLVQW